MAFPEIRHCLICDDMRQERLKKVSLLGFLGVSPDVQILIQDFEKPVDRLAFLLMGGPGDGTFKVNFEILDGDGKSIFPGLPAPIEMTLPVAPRSMFGFQYSLMKFPKPGVYTIVLLVDGEPRFNGPFEVAQGKPADFA